MHIQHPTGEAFEQEELAAIYVRRGLDEELAKRVAIQLMAHDAFTTHARDEVGISNITTARPVQAAFASGQSWKLMTRDGFPTRLRATQAPSGT